MKPKGFHSQVNPRTLRTKVSLYRVAIKAIVLSALRVTVRTHRHDSWAYFKVVVFELFDLKMDFTAISTKFVSTSVTRQANQRCGFTFAVGTYHYKYLLYTLCNPPLVDPTPGSSINITFTKCYFSRALEFFMVSKDSRCFWLHGLELD